MTVGGSEDPIGMEPGCKWPPEPAGRALGLVPLDAGDGSPTPGKWWELLAVSALLADFEEAPPTPLPLPPRCLSDGALVAPPPR